MKVAESSRSGRPASWASSRRRAEWTTCHRLVSFPPSSCCHAGPAGPDPLTATPPTATGVTLRLAIMTRRARCVRLVHTATAALPTAAVNPERRRNS